MNDSVMSPVARVRRTRRRLAAVVLTTAVLRALTFGVAVVVLAAIVDRLVPLAPQLRVAIIPLAALAALVGAAIVLWRGRALASLQRIALWLEEQEPSLRFALVTAVDLELASARESRGTDAIPDELRAAASAVALDEVAGRAWRRPFVRTLLGAAVAVALVIALGQAALLRTAAAGVIRMSPDAASEAPMPNRLEKLEARVEPPAYARLRAQTLKDPSSVAALPGSRVTFAGRGPAEGVSATAKATSHTATRDGSSWTIRVAMPVEPEVLTFRDREYSRPIVLEPLPDSAPRVRLALPARDTTWQQVPRGRLTIEARIEDDYGIDRAFFEFMLTAGGGEDFATRMLNSAPVRFGYAREGVLRATLGLDTLGLSPGTVLHITAIALDANDVTGPGRGKSETRTLRIAEPKDSTAIAPVPSLPIDSMWMSQRLLNLRTDTLIRDKPQLERTAFTNRSSGYANQQEVLRQRALAVVAVLEADGVGGAFQTETSAKLRRAADLMWTARMFLGVARPDTARPVMEEILAILDEIRLANRYYQRGIVPAGLVNIEAARLKGEGSALVGPRRGREPLPTESAELARRLDRAAALVRTSRVAAIDSLAHLRVTALRTAPAVASALERAIDSLRAGGGVEALGPARRALVSRARVEPRQSSGWGGGSP